MSDVKDPAAEAAPDPIKNLKAEYDRKLTNTENKLTELSKVAAQLLERINKPVEAPVPVKAAQEALEDLIYSDPKEFARRVRNEALEEVRSEQAAAAKTTSVLNQLVSEYPELGDQEHGFTKRAVEIYAAYSDEDKRSPMAMKAAVKEAALEMGVKTKSKRTNEDDYSVSSSTANRPSKRQKSTELDPATEAFAQMLQLEVTPEVKERLIARADRKWNKYSQPLPIKKK